MPPLDYSNKMKIKNKTLTLLLILPCISHAALNDYSRIETDCRKMNQDINNSVVMGCVDQASDAAKKDMNIVYQKIYKIIKARGIPDITSKFETAQKNWIAFRDSDCEFAISAYEGGSIQPLIKYTCLTEATQKRIEELENYLKEN